LEVILSKEYNVRQTEEYVRRLNGERIFLSSRPVPSVEIAALEERLRSRLGTRVRLRPGRKGGTLVIHYYSDEELNSLVESILGKSQE
jgi:ParB family chromosome partitioning protein